MNKPWTAMTLFAAAALAANAAVIFDGGTDNVYKATSDNTWVSLTESPAGTYTLTNGEVGVQNCGCVFGNFAATTLSQVGDEVKVSFTISGIASGANPFFVTLSGARGVTLTSSDVGFTGFDRSYAGLQMRNAVGSKTITYNRFANGPAGDTTKDRDILFTDNVSNMGTDVTGAERFDAGKTAVLTVSVVRASTPAFREDYTLDIAGGSSAVQSFSSDLYAPVSGDQFQLTDAFTTFAIGYGNKTDAQRLDSGSSLVVSDCRSSTCPSTSPNAARS